MRLPAFFPSVSSIKTNFCPLDYVELLIASGAPQFLVSAYDIAESSEKAQMKIAIERSLDRGTIILLDSGNYESYWKGDSKWTKARFHQILKECDWSIGFSFDTICGREPYADCAKAIAESCIEDQSQRPQCALFPIVHGESKALPMLCRSVAGLMNPLGIAVPERELGDGIFARIATVRRIRQALNELNAYYPLHLLGTGNPCSILLYTAAGAEMFDGLEWCQTVADPDNALLLHFQQRELIQNQLASSSSNHYEETTMLHNLLFYSQWMREVQFAMSSQSLVSWIRAKFAAPIASRVEAILNGH